MVGLKYIAIAVTTTVLATAVAVGSASAQTDIAPVGTYWQRVPYDDAFGGAGDQVPADVAAGGPGFVAVGNDSTGPLVQPAVWLSTDGSEWQRVSPGPDASNPDRAMRFEAVAGGGGTIVAVGTEGTGCEANFSLSIWGVCDSSTPAIWWSEDGMIWNRVAPDSALFHTGGDSTMSDVIATDDGFYALGTRRSRSTWDVVIWSSSDGRSWQVEHTVDSQWPVSGNNLVDLGFGVVAFVTESVDREVMPIAAVLRGGGYVVASSTDEDPTPANQLAIVESAGGGFTDRTIGLASDYSTEGQGALLTWKVGSVGFVMGPLTDGTRTIFTTSDGIAWTASTADDSAEPGPFTNRPHVLATPNGLVAVQFAVQGTALETLTWRSDDGAAWQRTGIQPPDLARVDAGFTGAAGIVGGVRAMAIDGEVAVGVGVDATGGDADAAFWFSVTGPLPDEDGSEPEPGTTFTTPSGCVITTDAVCPASDLDGADLSGIAAPGADLSLSNLTQANLAGADLAGVNLDGASLQGADLTGADLTGASLEAANLSGAKLDGATLTAVELEHTNLSGASLQGVEASSVDFGGFAPTVGADLAGADLKGAKLASADLTGIDLRGAVLDGANLTGANLARSQMDEVSMVGTMLSGANLSDAGLSGADFSGAVGREATFVNADLRGAIFVGADLTSAALFGADLTAADLTDTVYVTANFIEAILTQADLPTGDLDSADWGFTTCPDGFRTSRWPSPSCEGHRK